jgi:MFS family permease
MSSAAGAVQSKKLSVDFWKFWTGQAISSLGDSFTGFALPLLVFKLTGSAVNLALSTAAFMLPYLLFGLVLGAWADRVDRKRLMIGCDLVRAAVIVSIPVFANFNMLSIWWIYAVLFVNSTVNIAFSAADFAAIPSLVDPDNLVVANGRITASYSVTGVVGPLLAGALIAFLPIYDIIFIDGMSFLVSAGSLVWIRTSFNAESRKRSTNLRQDIVEGLKYVLSHPVLRMISAMMALVNFVSTTVQTQGVYFAKTQLRADDSQVGLLFAAGSAGVVALSLLAGPLRKRWTFSRVALGALMVEGMLTVVLSFMTNYYIALVIWALMSGFGILFNINTQSLRQAIVPNHMLGRVMTIAGVLAWSAIPLGSYIGGVIVDKTGNISAVYMGIGILVVLIPLMFSLTPLGRAEKYLPKKEEPGQPQEQVAPIEELPQEVIAEGEEERVVEVRA